MVVVSATATLMEVSNFRESYMPKSTHKIALDPNNKQRKWFAQQCGYARFAYNQALADFKKHRAETGEYLSAGELDARFNVYKKEYAWTADMDQVVSQQSIYKHLGAAITNWVKKLARFPRFKKKGIRDSFSSTNQSTEIKGKRIRLPKIGWIKMFEKLRFEGKISSVTISRTAHRWFASITVETENTIAVDKNSTHPVIGIDVGINTLATCSDGSKYENPRPLKRYEKKLARFQRRLSKRVQGSKNWYKQKAKIARLHYRIACIRDDAHHKATTDIVNRVSGIGVETLKVSNMLKHKKLAKALSDSALGGFLSMLKTKAAARGIKPKEAAQFFASSKTCSSCGHKKDDLKLSERTYHCGACGISIDRDVNAAINLKTLAAGHAESINDCGVRIRPRKSSGEEAMNIETVKGIWKQEMLPI